MSSVPLTRLSIEELQAEGGAALPPKEVLSLLDLNIDVDLALALASPIDLAVAANANAAVPINAAVSANVLSALSSAGAQSVQDMPVTQLIAGDAIANSTQVSTIDQTDTENPAPEPDPVEPGTDDPLGNALEGGLLNVDVNVALDADLAAPIAGAVAANANVAAPINASVAANVGAIGSEAIAVAQQTGSITQTIEGTAQATADQTSEIDQSDETTAP
jgi:hypothetical protein